MNDVFADEWKLTIPDQNEVVQTIMKGFVKEQYEARMAAGDSEEDARAVIATAFWATGGIESAGLGKFEANLYVANGVNLYFNGVHATPNVGVFYGAGPGLLTTDAAGLHGKEARYVFTLLPTWPLLAANVSWFSPEVLIWGNWTGLGTGTPTGGIPGAGSGKFTRTN